MRIHCELICEFRALKIDNMDLAFKRLTCPVANILVKYKTRIDSCVGSVLKVRSNVQLFVWLLIGMHFRMCKL